MSSCKIMLQTFKFTIHVMNLGLCLAAAGMLFAISASSGSDKLASASALPWLILEVDFGASNPRCEGLGISAFYDNDICGDSNTRIDNSYKAVTATCPIAVPAGTDPADVQAVTTINFQQCDSAATCTKIGKICGICCIVGGVFAVISAIGSLIRIFGRGARIASYSAMIAMNGVLIAFCLFYTCVSARKQYIVSTMSFYMANSNFTISLAPGASCNMAILSFVLLLVVSIMNCCLLDPNEKEKPMSDKVVIDPEMSRQGAKSADRKNQVFAAAAKNPPPRSPSAASRPAAAPAPIASSPPPRPSGGRPPPPRPQSARPPPPSSGNLEMKSNPMNGGGAARGSPAPPRSFAPRSFAPPARK